jgi:hypothetical protein
MQIYSFCLIFLLWQSDQIGQIFGYLLYNFFHWVVFLIVEVGQIFKNCFDLKSNLLMLPKMGGEVHFWAIFCISIRSPWCEFRFFLFWPNLISSFHHSSAQPNRFAAFPKI